MTPVAADQVSGSLLGLALGDALGAVVEALPPPDARDYVEQILRRGGMPARGPHGHPFGQVTDDTQLATELLLSIAETGEFDPAVFARRLLNLVAAGRLLGSGPAPLAAARQLALGLAWHEAGVPAPYAGNGAAMRAGPLGLLFGGNPRRLARIVSDQARVTHQDSRAAAGALAIAGGAALAARRERIVPSEFLVELSGWVEPLDSQVSTALWELANWVHLPPDQAAGYIAEHNLDPEAGAGNRWRGISSFVTGSVCWSLYAFLQAPDDYWDSICIAIGVGGDTDTLAAMTGAIAGGRCGARALPTTHLAALRDGNRPLAPELDRLGRQLAQR